MGSAALAAAVPCPGKATRISWISRKGQSLKYYNLSRNVNVHQIWSTYESMKNSCSSNTSHGSLSERETLWRGGKKRVIDGEKEQAVKNNEKCIHEKTGHRYKKLKTIYKTKQKQETTETCLFFFFSFSFREVCYCFGITCWHVIILIIVRSV